MGGIAIVKVRPGVEFTPDAAKAFQRAEAQVQSEFGRNISVNSTYRSWNKQLGMYNAWNAYVGGWGPYPGHSKAIHPMYSRHTNGTALDSGDWTSDRIRQILADNGFIRNQLHVPNEEHHFEYIRSEDKNYGKELDDMTPEERKMLKEIHRRVIKGLTGDRIASSVWNYKSTVNKVKFGDMLRSVFNSVRWGSKGHWHHGSLTSVVLSQKGVEVDVEELASAVTENLTQIDAQKLANAIMKAQGKALTDASS